jgi:hypothetical protein
MCASLRVATLCSPHADMIPVIATPEDVDEKLQSGQFDLVVLSAMLSQEEKREIQAKLPPGLRSLILETLVWPGELLRMVAEGTAINQEMSGIEVSREQKNIACDLDLVLGPHPSPYYSDHPPPVVIHPSVRT